MTVTGLNQAARLQWGRKIDQVRNTLGQTLVQLASKAGYDERTIRNAIAGQPTRLKTLHDICDALGIKFELTDNPVSSPVSGEDYGGYTYNQVHDYIGHYYAYRRSFSRPKSMVRSIYEIDWNTETACLYFKEHQKYESPELHRTLNFSQSGEIFISNTVNLVHMVTKYKGALRLITLTRIRPDDMTMHGVVMTQAQRSFHYQPSVSPIFLQRTDQSYSIEELEKKVGPMRPGDEDYDRVNALLIEVERNLAIFALDPGQDTPRLQVVSS